LSEFETRLSDTRSLCTSCLGKYSNYLHTGVKLYCGIRVESTSQHLYRTRILAKATDRGLQRHQPPQEVSASIMAS
jgi:hypothetical protein